MVKKKLFIIIPAYNEEETISKVIQTVPSFSNIDIRIIVIDDGSQDESADVAKKAGAEILSNKNNLGLGNTFMIGLNYSLKNKADIIVILDADGQYDSKDIKRIISPILNNEVDLMIGNRFLYNNTIYQNKFIKRIGNRVLSIFISKLLLRLNVIFDVQCSFRAFNRRLGAFLGSQLLAKYNYAQEMFILSWLYGFKVSQVPIDCYKRISGQSKLIKNSLIHLIKIIWISFRTFIKMKIQQF